MSQIRGALLMLWIALSLGLGGSQAADEMDLVNSHFSIGHTRFGGAFAWQDAVLLRARRAYHPPSRLIGQIRLASPISFVLPDTVPVVMGSADRGVLLFKFHDGKHRRPTICVYKGDEAEKYPRNSSAGALQEPVSIFSEREVRKISRSPGGISAPAIAMDRSGRFVVLWAEHMGDPELSLLQVQRFAANTSRIGGPLTIAAGALGVFDVAMTGRAANDPGDFVVVWLEPPSAILARAVNFTTGRPRWERFKVNARDEPGPFRIAAPTVTQNTAGEWMVAWREEPSSGPLRPGSEPQSPEPSRITAQNFDAEGAPLDIDFQVSDPTPVGIEGPSVATGGDRFVVVWAQGPDSIEEPCRLFGRMYQAGPYPCPGDCGNAKPLLRTGPPERSVDIVVSRESNLAGPSVTTGPEFGRFIVHTIVNGWFVHDIIDANRRKFNFYYVPLPRLSAPNLSRDVSVTVLNASSGDARVGEARIGANSHPSIFAHEVGHALFELADERGCGSGDVHRFEAPSTQTSLRPRRGAGKCPKEGIFASKSRTPESKIGARMTLKATVGGNQILIALPSLT